MDRDRLRAAWQALEDHYRSEPDAALITLGGIGGAGLFVDAGVMLLQALFRTSAIRFVHGHSGRTREEHHWRK